ncbi:FAD:protein FMN transferase [Sphingomonas cannabina]|uniref:FAD:protein FMN transferase n=1 Tax=Sphingomonas cannabina TaxID=2899123 RepID=UPI001F487B87|nr:FAD:protein FMN transferase [Sphingomonas cannabina]UIJ46410.1 FAD:protein FMN transferase [Sphingomonas cannabina]
MIAMQPERFAAMGTRVELHLFGSDDRDALLAARRAIEAVDDALTIHRPSATTALNECLMAGRHCRINDPVLLDALVEIEAAYAATYGLFDPAADASRPGTGWNMIAFDRDHARIEASRPVALDFGGFGKGFALDRACDVLRTAGVTSAFLCAGESSIAVVGEHPLGGGWPVAVPHPIRPGGVLAEFELRDEALSISSTVGAGTAAPERAAMIRPTDTSVITAPRTTVAIDRSGARAEVMSTALLVADDDLAGRLLDPRQARRFLFDFSREAAMPVQPGEMALQ